MVEGIRRTGAAKRSMGAHWATRRDITIYTVMFGIPVE